MLVSITYNLYYCFCSRSWCACCCCIRMTHFTFGIPYGNWRLTLTTFDCILKTDASMFWFFCTHNLMSDDSKFLSAAAGVVVVLWLYFSHLFMFFCCRCRALGSNHRYRVIYAYNHFCSVFLCLNYVWFYFFCHTFIATLVSRSLIFFNYQSPVWPPLQFKKYCKLGY